MKPKVGDLIIECKLPHEIGTITEIDEFGNVRISWKLSDRVLPMVLNYLPNHLADLLETKEFRIINFSPSKIWKDLNS
jgi:hypothetical protein